jgi:hypothetical protein
MEYDTQAAWRKQRNSHIDPNECFRYDIANFGEPRIILITDLVGKRSTVPRLGHVVLPNYAPTPWPKYKMPPMHD